MAPVHVEPHSCEHCQRLTIDVNDDGNRNCRRDGGNMAAKGTLFDFTLSELKLAADAGCQLCNWFLDQEAISRVSTIARSHTNEVTLAADSYNEVILALQDSTMWIPDFLGDTNSHPSFRNMDPTQSSKLNHHRLFAATRRSRLDIIQVDFFGLWNPVTRKIDYRTRYGFAIFAEPDDICSRTVSTRPIEANPGSDDSFIRISNWIHNCQSTHARCRLISSESGNTMPSRLLEIIQIGSHWRLHLKHTDDLAAIPSYCALSYCWGGDQPLKCVSSNISRLLVAIQFIDLPQTIQDAIVVCRRVGIQYLWVDALCIIQDDINDKTKEIAKMSYIYRDALFTILAARSNSVQEGFLHERLASPRPSAVKLPYKCSDGQVGSVILLDMELSPQPIDARAWTFQERFLSNRMVEFGPRQTRWICSHYKHQGDYTDGWRIYPEYEYPEYDKASQDLPDLNETFRPSEFESQFEDAQQRWFRSWARVVEAYTQKSLTFSSDRPLAISGIAEAYGKFLPEEYRAGLWQSAFHAGLLWKTSPYRRNRNTAWRPTTYQGPSWSWLSVQGPISYPYLSLKEWTPTQCQAEILGASLSLVSSLAPYGAVHAGELKLRARTAAGVASKSTRTDLLKDYVRIYWSKDSGRVCIGIAHMSSDDWESDFGEGNQDNIPGVDYIYKIPSPSISGSQDTIVREVPDAAVPDRIHGSNPAKAGSPSDCVVTVLELQSAIRGYSWQCQGLVLREITSQSGVFCRVGTFEYNTNGTDTRRSDEPTDVYEDRVNRELNWFKNCPYKTVVII